MPPVIPVGVRAYVTDRCELNCQGCINAQSYRRFTRSRDASFEEIRGLVLECKRLGIKCMELAGGDPLLWKWIIEILALCKYGKERVHTLLPVSAPGLVSSFDRIGRDWLTLPHKIRISTPEHPRFGIRSLKAADEALEVLKDYRPTGTTQLGIVLIPGDDGNLRKDVLGPYFSMAEKQQVQIHLSPIQGSWQNGKWELCNSRWDSISKRQKSVLAWAIRQSVVLPQSVDKVLSRLDGGNDHNNTVCKAGESVVTVRNGIVVKPCDLISCYHFLAKDGLDAEVGEMEAQGTFPHCQGCVSGCNDALDLLSHYPDQVETFCSM